MLKEQLREFLAFLRYNRNVSPHTLRAYETDLSQFLESLASSERCQPSQLRAAHFTADHVREFLGELHQRGNSRASAARRLSALRTFARYLMREDVLGDDPTALVGAPKRDQTLPAHLGLSDMDRLLDAPDAATPAGRRDRAILELFYASGLRLSELVGREPVGPRRARARKRQEGTAGAVQSLHRQCASNDDGRPPVHA